MTSPYAAVPLRLRFGLSGGSRIRRRGGSMGELARALGAPKNFFADHAYIGAFLVHLNSYTDSLFKYNGLLN